MFKLVMEAYPVGNDYGQAPEWAEITVTPEFMSALERLAGICRSEGLESVSVKRSPDRWGCDEEDIWGDSLRVTDDCFMFEASPIQDGFSIESRMVRLSDLRRLVRNGGALDGLSDCFALRDGVVFYSHSDPEALAERYFEELENASSTEA